MKIKQKNRGKRKLYIEEKGRNKKHVREKNDRTE
jgi:hypothetical protein